MVPFTAISQGTVPVLRHARGPGPPFSCSGNISETLSDSSLEQVKDKHEHIPEVLNKVSRGPQFLRVWHLSMTVLHFRR